jgi:hypothetical protein
MHHPAQATFLVIYCTECQREVLSASDLDEHDQIVDVCMHCDRHLDRNDDSARWVDAHALTEHGYFVDGLDTAEDRHGGSGCRGGSCGVQQPE